MKRFHICLLSATLVWFLLLLLCFPYTINSVEADDLFLWDGEFLKQVLTRCSGVMYLLEDFICQFFSVTWLGALITAIIVALPVEFLYLALRRLGKESWGYLAFIPSQFILFFTFPYLESPLRYMFFVLLIYLYTLFRKDVSRIIYAFLIILPSFCLLAWYEVCLMYLVFAAFELVVKKSRIGAALMLVFLGISLFVPGIWSDYVDFIPFKDRPSLNVDNMFPLKLLPFYLLTVALYFVPLKWHLNLKLQWSLSILSIVVFGVVMRTSETLAFEEKSAKLSSLADAKDWESIISDFPYDEVIKSRILTSYVLLAMNATGSMADNLFAYPINSPEMFLFRHEEKPFYVNFNRQFYDNIGIWNECYHMAFEYGVTQRENDCFKAMREKIDYSIKLHDFAAAHFYLDLLSKSCFNNDFVASRRDAIEAAEKQSAQAPKLPYISDTYVGAYPMASEMFRLFERNEKSKKILDYVLCSLLLNKEVEKFAIVLQHYNLYQGDRMPLAYSEALAACKMKNPGLVNIDYDHDQDKYFADFLQRANQQQDISEYATTYWAYLYYRPVDTAAN